MNVETIQFLLKNRRLKQKRLLKEIKIYIRTSSNGLDFYWCLKYFNMNFVFEIITKLEKTENIYGIEKILKILPYLENKREYYQLALKYLQSSNINLIIPSLNFFKYKRSLMYLPFFDKLIHIDNLRLIQEIIETIGFTKPPNSSILLNKIQKIWREKISEDFLIRAKMEMGFY